MANEILSTYDCTQQELYAICNLGWHFTKNHQSTLSIKYPIYTTQYIDDHILNITNAEALPGFQERDQITESDRIELLQLAAPAIENWDLLSRYIHQAFVNNKSQIKPHVEAAGKEFHEAATRPNPNWEDLKQMLLDGDQYITNNPTILSPIMPPTFPTDYATAMNAYLTKYTTFLNNKFIKTDGTSDKIIANNAIHAELMSMLTDLRVVVPEHKKSNFTFSYIKDLISSPGTAGLRADIRQKGSNILLPGALVSFQAEGGLLIQQTSDPEGRVDFNNLEPGIYEGNIQLENHITLPIQFTISTGVHSFKHWLLEPA